MVNNTTNGVKSYRLILFNKTIHYSPFVEALRRRYMERAKGIEPSHLAWEANALPLCNARRDVAVHRVVHPGQYVPISEGIPVLSRN